LFAYFFFYRFLRFFKYYKGHFSIPEFSFSFYFPEFDFFYAYFFTIIHRFILYFMRCSRVLLTALVFWAFKVRRYFPFYFLSKNKSISLNFFTNYFFFDEHFQDPSKSYLVFSKLYHLPFGSYLKQMGKITIWSRFFFQYKCFFLFLQLKFFFLFKYDVFFYNSFFFRVVSSLDFCFLIFLHLSFCFAPMDFEIY